MHVCNITLIRHKNNDNNDNNNDDDDEYTLCCWDFHKNKLLFGAVDVSISACAWELASRGKEQVLSYLKWKVMNVILSYYFSYIFYWSSLSFYRKLLLVSNYLFLWILLNVCEFIFLWTFICPGLSTIQ